MKALAKILSGAAILVAGVCLLGIPQFAASGTPPVAGIAYDQAPNPDEPIPAFHMEPPKEALPPTMEPSLFPNIGVFNAYMVAGRVKKVLYQQPCYCHCDRSQGHGSLLDCFVGRHGAGCDTCMREAFYSYEQTRKGKTPAQIRDGIIHGEWEKVDVAKYQTAYLPPANAPVK